MIKRSICYFALALSLAAPIVATPTAFAQSVVTGADPEPMSSVRVILLILKVVVLP